MRLPQDNLTQKEILEARERVAMKDLNHFRRWIQESDREFLTFNSKDLIDALEFAPENLELVQQIVQCYRQHRMAIKYDTKIEIEPITGEEIEVSICKDDRLTVAEMDRLVRKLAGQLFDRSPGWSLDSEPIG